MKETQKDTGNAPKKEYIIGIDLGTSTSEVAVFRNDRPILIPDADGETIIPSVVHIDKEGVILTGIKAAGLAVVEPENTVIEIKRKMGSQLPIKVAGGNFLPEEISSHILAHLKKAAEDYLEQEVNKAVITVPAYFTEAQRAATKKAGELAGLQVERIINEPTAAALAYGIDRMELSGHILVYDFGGGTLDVSVLEMFEGIMEVKSTCGNSSLGGKDIDEAIINWLIDEFNKETGIDLSNDKRAVSLMKEAAVKAKITLSEKDKAIINIPFIAEKKGIPEGINKVLGIEHFESMIESMVKSTEQQVRTALNDASVAPENVDVILLVGGTTRIPMVKRLLKEIFGKEPSAGIDPERAVAAGAAIQAGIIGGDLSGDKDIILTDICPFTLGIECTMEIMGIDINGCFDPLILKNTVIPASVEKEYTTALDDQTVIRIKVYQGENNIAVFNNPIGSFLVEGIPPRKAKEETITVIFKYDINGMVDIRAIIDSTGMDGRILIDTNRMNVIEDEYIEHEWKKSKRAIRYKGIVKKAEKTLSGVKLDEQTKELVKYLLRELKLAVIREDESYIRRMEDELTEILYG